MFFLPLLIAASLDTVSGDNAPVTPPSTVKVLPVFFVPHDVDPPTVKQKDTLMRHLSWTQARYKELLPGHITFKIAQKKPLVFQAPETLEFYRQQPEGGAPRFVSELVRHLRYTRYNCPYILFVVLMNPKDDFPGAGGRPINGGFNTGGGIVIFSSYSIDRAPNVQSTFQHELGHAFGLPHVDSYGFDMMSNPSLMSYNPQHHTNGFMPSHTPGVFNPEDLRALALNQRVFPGLTFQPGRDIPAGYQIQPYIVGLGPMNLPDGLANVHVSSLSGNLDGSDAQNVLIGSVTPGSMKFDPSSMWRSEKVASGKAILEVDLPVTTHLTRIRVHSMLINDPEAILAITVMQQEEQDEWRKVGTSKVRESVTDVQLRSALSKRWRLEFTTQPGNSVVIRGIEFFDGNRQLFLPLVPF